MLFSKNGFWMSSDLFWTFSGLLINYFLLALEKMFPLGNDANISAVTSEIQISLLFFPPHHTACACVYACGQYTHRQTRIPF